MHNFFKNGVKKLVGFESVHICFFIMRLALYQFGYWGTDCEIYNVKAYDL